MQCGGQWQQPFAPGGDGLQGAHLVDGMAGQFSWGGCPRGAVVSLPHGWVPHGHAQRWVDAGFRHAVVAYGWVAGLPGHRDVPTRPARPPGTHYDDPLRPGDSAEGRPAETSRRSPRGDAAALTRTAGATRRAHPVPAAQASRRLCGSEHLPPCLPPIAPGCSLGEYERLDFPLGHGWIHGDAYPGNTLWDGDRALLGDWDEVGTGPRELDLVNTHQGARFGRPQAERAAFTAAYGYDVTAWPGFPVLREIRDLHTLGSYMRLAGTGNRRAAIELGFRLGTLKRGDADAQWNAR